MTLTTAREIREAVVVGKASAVEFARAALARIEQTNPTLNAFNHLVRTMAVSSNALERFHRFVKRWRRAIEKAQSGISARDNGT